MYLTSEYSSMKASKWIVAIGSVVTVMLISCILFASTKSQISPNAMDDFNCLLTTLLVSSADYYNSSSVLLYCRDV